MAALFDRVQHTVSGTPGTGPVTLGPASSGRRTFALAGAQDGQSVNYVLEDGLAWEYGIGTYSASGPTLARTTITASSNGGAAINASSAAVVYCDVFANDLTELTPTDSRLMLWQIAKARGTAFQLLNSFADDYKDQQAIDANSTGTNFDLANNAITNADETAQSLPPMTGNTAPSGYTVSASSSQGGSEDVYKAFDGIRIGGSGACWTSNGTMPDWVQRTNPVAYPYWAYTITPRSDGFGKPTAWNVYGVADDGVTLTLLDSQTGQNLTNGVTYQFTIPSAKRLAYKTLRVTFTASTESTGSGLVSVAEVEFLKSGGGPMGAKSIAITAQTPPSTASGLILVKATTGTLAANSNFTLSVTRDGGATWSTLTLAALGTLNGYTVLQALNTSLAAQPSGTTLKYLVSTSGGLQVAVDVVVLLWL